MKKDNTVIFKGGKDGIIAILAEDADFPQISKSLRQKIKDAGKFFDGAKTSITFKGKKLTETEILSLLDIFHEETELSVTFVEDLTGQLPITAQIKNAAPPPDTQIYYHKSGLRSGQAIHQNGSVVILGDINPGAEVIAAGNIIVFGAARGLLHAGFGGYNEAFICALSLQPPQLRIGEHKVYFPKEMINENKNKIDPMYAFVRDGQIYISQMGS